MTSGPPSRLSYFDQEMLWIVSIKIAWSKVLVRFWLEFSFVFSFVFWDLNVLCIQYFYIYMCVCMFVCVYLSTNLVTIISSEWGALENSQV